MSGNEMGKEQESATKRLGRPPLPASEGKRHALGIRTTAGLKAQIEAAAHASGRSLAQEIEHRLERSFRDENWLDATFDEAYGSRNAGVMMLLGRVMRDASDFAERATLPDWLNDDGDFDAVVRGFDTVIAALRPPRPAAPNETGGAAYGEWRAVHNANSALRGVGDPETPYRLSGGWSDKVRSRLGSVAERLWRYTGPAALDFNDTEGTSS